jgi:hypothetical protein
LQTPPLYAIYEHGSSFLHPNDLKLKLHIHKVDLKWIVHIVPPAALLNVKHSLNKAISATAAVIAASSLMKEPFLPLTFYATPVS